jgi:hypothetical protein
VYEDDFGGCIIGLSFLQPPSKGHARIDPEPITLDA